jgi:hypothetical protein
VMLALFVATLLWLTICAPLVIHWR